MRTSFETCGAALLALLLAVGCSALTDFGRYQPNGGRDGGGMDGDVPAPDGGDEDGGDGDGGGPEDGGPADGGPGDGGPPACDPICGEGETCLDGNCMCGTRSACADTEACCDGDCRALDTVTDCGGCDVACPTRDNATTVCGDAGCTFECNTGFEDCNGQEADGCEASLSSAETCGDCTVSCAAGEVCGETGGTRSCRTDCPGAMVACGGSCFTPGGSCTCTTGSVPGTQMCNAASMTVVCDYPAEACNAVDDDCDGSVNEGFACNPGQMRSCTTSCGSTGVELCVDTTCAWSGSCTVMERCDRTDTDCDGFVDEGLLAPGSPFIGTSPSVRPRAAVNPIDSEIGVVLGDPSGGPPRFFRTTLDGTVLAASISLPMSGSTTDWDIAFDGSDYVVAVADRSSSVVHVLRVARTGAPGASYDITGGFGASPLQVRLDRIATLSEVAVLTTTEQFGGTPSATVTVLRLDPGVTISPVRITTQTLASSGGGGGRWFRAPAVVRTASEAFVAFTDSMSGSGEVRVNPIGPGGGVGPTIFLAPDSMDEVNTEMAFDPVSSRVGIVFQKLDPSGGLREGFLAAIDTATFSVSSEIRVDTASLSGLGIGTAADGNFGVLLRSTSGATRLDRYRASDLATVPGAVTPPVDYAEYLQGVGTSTTRYVAFRGRGSSLATLPYGCAP